MAQISEAATIYIYIYIVYSFGELFNQAKLDEQRWEEYLVSVDQRIVDDVPCKAPIPPAQASPSLCNAEQCPYYHTCTESMGTW